MSRKPVMSEAAAEVPTPQADAPLPGTGGAWVRQPDGSLVREDAPQPEPAPAGELPTKE